MCAALVLPPALLLLATPLLWESPFWLTSRGRHAQVGCSGRCTLRSQPGRGSGFNAPTRGLMPAS